MATQASTADHITDILSGAGDITARKMFGEYGVYCDGKFFALICDDTLFIKPTPQGLGFAGDLKMGAPYPNAKPHIAITADQLEEPDWLCELARVTCATLPTPKPKAARRPRKV